MHYLHRLVLLLLLVVLIKLLQLWIVINLQNGANAFCVICKTNLCKRKKPMRSYLRVLIFCRRYPLVTHSCSLIFCTIMTFRVASMQRVTNIVYTFNVRCVRLSSVLPRHAPHSPLYHMYMMRN